MSVKEVDKNIKEYKEEKELNKVIVVITKNEKKLIVVAEYFGKVTGFEDFIGFWKAGEENPYMLFDSKDITLIEVLDESIEDFFNNQQEILNEGGNNPDDNSKGVTGQLVGENSDTIDNTRVKVS